MEKEIKVEQYVELLEIIDKQPKQIPIQFTDLPLSANLNIEKIHGQWDIVMWYEECIPDFLNCFILYKSDKHL